MALHVLDEANRCLGCKKPMCQEGCPILTNIPEVIRLLKAIQMDDAGRMLFENNPLTTVCSLVCNHEKQCEGHCIRNRMPSHDPVHFSIIEDYISTTYANKMPAGPAPKNGMKVAVVGSGPAGLTIAVLVHLAIVQMFNDQVVQGQASHFQAALEQQRAEALMESYTAQRRLTHEFTNHIAALDALLRQGDLTGAQEYLSSERKVVAAGTTILDTHNPLLDSLLSRKYEEAAQQGVELYFDLCDLKDLPFCGTDLVIGISELNRVQKDLVLVDGELPRSTMAEPGHCMGRVNAREVLDRCRCEYTLSCRDRWFLFSCAVPTRKL